jgi:signal transduction histidine kinase
VQEYCDGLAPLFAQKKVRLVFKPHPEKLPIKSDLALFRSVILESLTSNALEYTPAGGTVHISLEELGQSFMLKVSDSGIGIPESERGRIFEKMFRGSNASLMKAGGTGLGLYMVKKVVLLLGGAIRFESEENKGTTFFIELLVA